MTDNKRLTTVVVGRCKAARLALAAGSLHGDSVVWVILAGVNGGNVVAIAGKALVVAGLISKRVKHLTYSVQSVRTNNKENINPVQYKESTPPYWFCKSRPVTSKVM